MAVLPRGIAIHLSLYLLGELRAAKIVDRREDTAATRNFVISYRHCAAVRDRLSTAHDASCDKKKPLELALDGFVRSRLQMLQPS